MDNPKKFHLSKSRKSMREYYDEVGWKDYSGTTIDSAKNIDFRIKIPNVVYQGFPKEGHFILDVGCGANPRISLSGNYKKHICLDFSIRGLKIARTKLRDKGFCICGDIINLPFPDNSFDAIICDHVLYHFLPEEQVEVIDELYRVLIQGGVIYISYTKGDGWLPGVLMRGVKSVLRKTPLYYFYRLQMNRNAMKQKNIEKSSIYNEVQKAGAPIFNPLPPKWWSEHLDKKGYQCSLKGIGELSAKTTRMMPRCLAIFMTSMLAILSKHFNFLIFPLLEYYYMIIKKPDQ